MTYKEALDEMTTLKSLGLQLSIVSFKTHTNISVDDSYVDDSFGTRMLTIGADEYDKEIESPQDIADMFTILRDIALTNRIEFDPVEAVLDSMYQNSYQRYTSNFDDEI